MMPPRHARTATLVWALLIVAACSVPGRSLPSVDLFEFDKLVHFGLFAVLGWLWMTALGRRPRRRAAWVLVLGSAFSVLTELYQGILPWEREPDPYDALANCLGLLAAVIAVAAYHRLATRHASAAHAGRPGGGNRRREQL